MKTLNRTLSLTLVFALVFSLMSFAFAADTTATTTTKAPKLSDFTDADKLTYTEAADYLIAAGVVKGDTATTLNPKGDFTRAQAAKLVAYAALGQIAADNLKASVAPFEDVDASNWAAGYIAYCQKQGLVNGYGDGNFGPNDKVTGYQIGKMLLCSLGYGVNGEFTGFGWTLEVAKYALAKDIFYGNTAGASNAAVTREEAFLYTCNALNRAMLVKYNDNLKVYYSGTNPFEDNQKFHEEYTIGYQRFMMRYVASDGTYDEPAHYWAIDGKKVTGIYPNDPITKLASSADGTPYDKLTTKGTAKYIGCSKDDNVVYYINGDKQTKTEAGKDVSDDTAVKAAAGVRGNVVNFYDTDKNGKYDTVEVLVYKVAKLTAAPAVRTGGGNSVVTMTDLNNGYGKQLKDIVDTNIDGDFASLKKDDYVLYYANKAGTAWTIAKCETVAGQLFGFNDTAYMLNINGTNYNASTISTNYAADADAAKVAFGKAWKDITDTKGLAGTTFYLDAGKNIVAAEPTENVIAAGNVVYVLQTGNLAGAYSARVLKADGTASVKSVAQIIDVKNQPKAASNVAENTFYTFVENKDGSLTLKEIDPAFVITNEAYTKDATPDAVQDTVFKKGAASFFLKDSGAGTTQAPENVLGTSKTVFVIENDGSYAGTYKAYTGVSTIPTVRAAFDGDASALSTTAKVLKDKDGYAIMAVALGGKLDTTYNTNDYVVTFTDASTVSKTSNASEDYHTYQYAVVNGEIKNFDSTNLCDLDAGIYAVNSYDNGKVAGVLTNPADMAKTRLNNTINAKAAADLTATGFDVVGNTVTVKGDAATNFVVTNDVKVFVFDAFDKTAGIVSLDKLGSIDAIANLRGDAFTVMGLSVSNTNETINELYITIMPKNATPAPAPATGIKSVTHSGDVYTVNYYGATAPTEAAALAAVKAQIAKDGYVITKTVLDGTKYEFTVTKGDVEVKNPLTFDPATTGIAKLFKVTLANLAGSATDQAQLTLNGIAAKTDVYAIDGTLYVKAAGGTVTVTVKTGTMTVATDVKSTVDGATMTGTPTLALADTDDNATKTLDVPFGTVTDDVTITMTATNHA